jgi:hypothetical protein
MLLSPVALDLRVTCDSDDRSSPSGSVSLRWYDCFSSDRSIKSLEPLGSFDASNAYRAGCCLFCSHQ